MKYLNPFIGALVALLVILFAVSNRQAVTVELWPFPYQLALSLYAVMSKRDFSAWGSFFIVGLWVLIATSLINLFVGSATASLWIAGGTVLVFSGLLVFDTWRIVRSGQYGPDDYVPAAVNIYLDLLNLFLALVSLLGGRRRD
jgi:FtsH-binding integral membrane protein